MNIWKQTIGVKESVTLNEKKVSTATLKFLSFANFKEVQHSWWEFECALQLTE